MNVRHAWPKIYRKIRRFAEPWLAHGLVPIIFFLWRRDKKTLPLVSAHWPLYLKINQRLFFIMRRFPDLRNPKSIGEKLQWLKLFDQDWLQVECADKIKVRDYISNLVGEGFTPKVLWEGKDPRDLLTLELSAPFVVKTNHDSGSVFVVTAESSTNLTAIIRRLQKAIVTLPGEWSAEPIYQFIEPRVFVEEYIPSGSSSPQPDDWKFACVDGRVKWVQYIRNRHAGGEELILGRDGKKMNARLSPSFALAREVNIPPQWGQLIDRVETLAARWKFVRVDTYVTEHSFYFGELTFYPKGGFYHPTGREVFGDLMNFSLDTTREPCISMEIAKRKGKDFRRFPGQ